MKVGQLAQLAFIVVAAMTVYGFVTVARGAEARRACVPLCAMHPNYAGKNRTAPDFALKDLRGNEVRLSSLRGKTVILNFWTKTCRPCLEEMPSLADLARMLAPRKDVVVLAVSTDEGPDAVKDTLRALVRADEPPFQVLFDPEQKVVADAYGTHMFPETWIIDPRGVIRARFDGARDWSNTLVLDLIDSFERPAACGVEFRGGVASGPAAGACDDTSAGE